MSSYLPLAYQLMSSLSTLVLASQSIDAVVAMAPDWTIRHSSLLISRMEAGEAADVMVCAV